MGARRLCESLRRLADDERGSMLSRGITIAAIIVFALFAVLFMSKMSDQRVARGVVSAVAGKGSTGAGITLLPF